LFTHIIHTDKQHITTKVSQLILNYAEQRSSKTRSSAHYPAGASRLEPLGVLSCAALMGFASFGVLKEAIAYLYEGIKEGNGATLMDENWSSFWSMTSVVIVKLILWLLCQKVAQVKGSDNKYHVDSTIEAVGLDHWNDCLSNAVAAIALLFTLSNEIFWILDPIGAIIISLYIIFSWYSTGREQIEQLTGKAAPADFIDELYEMAANFDAKMEVDVVRAYHFGPKFLVELEVVLPKDTLLFESHDLGMELQYEIESREEVERCFVHIDYESRPYDEHVVSKVPELRERYRPYKQSNSAVSI
jgi:cation diffusion facilitator family transporter